MHLCTICGEAKLEGQVWFLIAESHWEDRLKILQWQEELANRRGMHQACCPAHVQELATQWMTDGNLDFLLASAEFGPDPRVTRSTLPIVLEPDTRGGRQIGELAVDRESVERALKSNPDSLLIILDELRDSLERETAGASTRLEASAAIGLARPT